jgi:hypothetical protein
MVAKEEQEKSRKLVVLEYISYGLAATAVIIGLLAVFRPHFPNFIADADKHDNALMWFAFALLSIMIPYIKEITFRDLKIVVDKIGNASETLDGAAISVKELNNRINATRDELIDGYQELLRMLPEIERDRRVLKMSRLYLQEMGIEVETVKKWLIEVHQPISNMDSSLDEEYLKALRAIQEAHGLGNDGIFGYRTLNLINQLRGGRSG